MDTATTSTSSAPQLKYLAFLRAAVIQIYVYLIALYEHLKDKSGALKPGIERVESLVKSVTEPVVERVQIQPDDYLVFVDKKVDATIKYAQENTPAEVKRQASTLYDFVSHFPEKAQDVVDELNQKGPVATAKGYYQSLLPILWAYVLSIWSFTLALPLVPQVVAALQPYVYALAVQYNTALTNLKKSDLPIVKPALEFLPLVPVEKLKKSE